MTDETKAADTFEDLPAEMRPVAEQYGRDLFALVYNAGMANQALAKLVELAQKHHSRGGLHAVEVMAHAFNQVSNTYVQTKGWEEGQLEQCDRDIQRAFASKLVVPPSAILLAQ